MVACREARQLSVLAAAKKAGRSPRYREIERPEAIASERADQQVVSFVGRDAYGSCCGGRLWKPGARKNVCLRLAFAELSALMLPATTSLRFTGATGHYLHHDSRCSQRGRPLAPP
jgi:hypothetical protein